MQSKRWIVILLCVLLVAVAGISLYCIWGKSSHKPAKPQTPPEVKEAVAVEEPPQFTSEEIPENIRQKMQGVTISENSVVTFDDLAYLTISYVDYDGNTQKGNMIVDKEIADEVISIFKELYDIKFPIEKMRLPCEYDGIDEKSMQDNNTSAFNDRPIEGSGGLSYHQLGRAIDLNPLVNPYIRFSDGLVLPTTATEYLDRTTEVQGMINADSPCVEIFKKYGWVWGGDWNSLKDYQHFEKH